MKDTFTFHLWIPFLICLMLGGINVSLGAIPLNMAPASQQSSPQQLNRAERFLLKRLSKRLDRLARKQAQREGECAKIVLQTGEVIEADILEITADVVRYKRCGKAEDPSMMLAKSEVLSVIATDGGFLYKNTGSANTGFDESSGPQQRGGVLSSAVLSMGFSITGFVIGLLPLFSVAAALLSLGLILTGLVLGIASLSKIARGKGRFRGRGFAIAGIVISSLYLLLIVVTIFALL